MSNTPFVSSFGVRHGTQTIRLGPDDIERLLRGSTIEADVLGKYVAEITYDPTREPLSKQVANLDANFFSENGWDYRKPGCGE